MPLVATRGRRATKSTRERGTPLSCLPSPPAVAPEPESSSLLGSSALPWSKTAGSEWPRDAWKFCPGDTFLSQAGTGVGKKDPGGGDIVNTGSSF